MKTRLWVSPVEGNLGIGALRTHVYTIASIIKDKTKDNLVLRCDNIASTDMQYLARFTQALETLFSLKFSTSEFVCQSNNSQAYTKYMNKLHEDGFLLYINNWVAFNIQKYKDIFGDTIVVTDKIFGTISFSVENSGLLKEHFYIRKSDWSTFLYNFASVVDDYLLWITDVFRGQDKIPTVLFQEMIRRALWFQEKNYIHLPLLESKILDSGEKIKANINYEHLLKQGYSSWSIMNYILSSWYWNPDVVYANFDEFLDAFSLDGIHSKSAFIDTTRLGNINKQFLQGSTFEEYLASYLLFLWANNEVELLEWVQLDIDIQFFSNQLRYSFSELTTLLKNIKSPIRDIEMLSENHILFLKEYGRGVSQCKYRREFEEVISTFSSKKVAYQAVRWIFCGKVAWPAVDLMFGIPAFMNIAEKVLYSTLQKVEW